MLIGEHKYSYIKSFLAGDALDFSKRPSFVREIMLERVFPTRIILPLKQHYGDECIPAVSVGDHVLIGQCVGVPAEGSFAVPIHSGISGFVKEIKPIRLPNGVSCNAIYIESDRKRTRHPSVVLPRMELNISASTTMGVIKNAGIVGLGREGIPTIAKINRARNAKVEELLVNVLQSEPYAVGDLFIAGEYADYVIMGAIAVAGACGTNKIRICIAANQAEEIEALKSAIDRALFEYPDFQIEFRLFKDRYPQGYYRLIAKALYGKMIGENETLEDSCKAVLFNCSTLYACWDAIAGNMPLTSKIISITTDRGDAHNVLAPIGTPISELLNTINGISATENIVVWGNCLTGIAINDPDNIPVIKTTPAISVIHKREIVATKCVHCGRCEENCPMGVNPGLAAMLIRKGAINNAVKERLGQCIACGICSYVCPSGLDLTGVLAAFSNKIKSQSKQNNKERVFHQEQINLGNVSLLEMYSEDEANYNSKDKDSIYLPFEGGKEV